jgi:L-cysteine/cystine lyase
MSQGKTSGRLMTEPAGFRSHFPVLERVAYLNAGTEGPLPHAAVEAVNARIELEATEGRCGRPYFDQLIALAGELRAAYARTLGCDAEQVALTGSTTDGVNTVIAGLDLRPGDEVLTSDEEHPGLLAPLARAQRARGIEIRVVPFEEVPAEVRPGTRLVACSHVSWVGGRIMEVEALRSTGVPILLDAAQALGAIPVDVQALGVDFYAASGQKWLCGPEGSGCLYVRPDRLEELLVPWPGYGSLADPHEPMPFSPAEGTARLDHGFPAGMRSAWALASLGVFESAGWRWVHDRAASLAQLLADRLEQRGLEVSPRDSSTLVSWKTRDADSEVQRLAAEGFVVRSIPAFDLVRASAGAWSSEEEIEALAAEAVQ